MRLLLLADTHVPRRARDLPPSVWHEVDAADLVVHAGDWVDVGLLEKLRSRAVVLGVVGNNDGAELRAELPELAVAELDGVHVGVVHETGPSAGRERRMSARHPRLDLLVFGHSHIPWDTVTDSGLRLLNPGSPTDRRRQPAGTFMTVEISAGSIGDVVLHEV